MKICNPKLYNGRSKIRRENVELRHEKCRSSHSKQPGKRSEWAHENCKGNCGWLAHENLVTEDWKMCLRNLVTVDWKTRLRDDLKISKVNLAMRESQLPSGNPALVGKPLSQSLVPTCLSQRPVAIKIVKVKRWCGEAREWED